MLLLAIHNFLTESVRYNFMWSSQFGINPNFIYELRLLLSNSVWNKKWANTLTWILSLFFAAAKVWGFIFFLLFCLSFVINEKILMIDGTIFLQQTIIFILSNTLLHLLDEILFIFQYNSFKFKSYCDAFTLRFARCQLNLGINAAFLFSICICPLNSFRWLIA